MKKKILVVIADYYKDISNDLLKSAIKNLNKKFYSIKLILFYYLFMLLILRY